MLKPKKIPFENNNDFISDILSTEKIKYEKIVASSQLDMNESFDFYDGFVAFDSEKIL